ncbi:PH domain-containing protein [Paludisphaera sp.]|uniref:PH domain-containing protein n=1 Tax=Paludisphaera sp. TaxID=2017432 RepID=UPI00301BE675
MPIQVACRCGKTITAPDEYAGRKGKCKACGEAVAIPAPARRAEPDFPPPPPKPAADDFSDPLPGAPADETLYSASPSMFRNRPVQFILGAGLIVSPVVMLLVLLAKGTENTAAFGYFILSLVASPLAMLAFLKWWLDCRATRLVITRKRISLKRGILSRRLNEVRVADIRNVRVDQTALQRLFGVGSVGVSSSGQGDVEIEVHGIPTPQRVREILDDLRG